MERKHSELLTHLTTLHESLVLHHRKNYQATIIRNYNVDIEAPSEQAKRVIKETKEISNLETKIHEVTGEAEELRILILYTRQKRSEEKERRSKRADKEKEVKERELLRLERQLDIAKHNYTTALEKFQDNASSFKNARWINSHHREAMEAGICGCEVRCGSSECLSSAKIFKKSQRKAVEVEGEMENTMELLENADRELDCAEQKARKAGLVG